MQRSSFQNFKTLKIDILLTITLCNATDAPHKSVRQNFKLFLGTCATLLKNQAFLLKQKIDQWMLQSLSSLGKQN